MMVSVVLPTFNEAKNIVDLVRCIGEAMPTDWDYELIVVDDASPDGTYAAVNDAFRDNPRVVPVLRATDPGLAASILEGIKRAQGEQVLVMDTDFTHDPVEIPRLLHVAKLYDIVSGSRFCAGGRMVDTAHYLSSMIYNWLLRLVLRTQVQDNLGGYFTAKRAHILALPVERIFFGYGDYFFRLLHYAQAQGLSVVEIPAQYLARSKGDSKSNYLKMVYTYTKAAVLLKYETYRLRRRRVA